LEETENSPASNSLKFPGHWSWDCTQCCSNFTCELFHSWRHVVHCDDCTTGILLWRFLLLLSLVSDLSGQSVAM